VRAWKKFTKTCDSKLKLVAETQELLSSVLTQNAKQEFIVCFLHVFAKKDQAYKTDFINNYSSCHFKQALALHSQYAEELCESLRDRSRVRHFARRQQVNGLN
jgi:hypothetical protein